MRAIPCEATWFDGMGEPGSRLRIAVLASHPAFDEFWSRLDIGLGLYVRFTALAFIQGRRLYEATEWRPADGPDQFSPDPLLLLVGPFQGASSGAP